MKKFYYYQDEKVVIWLRHSFTVSAESQKKADDFVRENKLSESTGWHDDGIDDRVYHLETNEMLETQQALSVEENHGNPTLEIIDAEKKPVADNCGNRQFLSTSNLWRKHALAILNENFPNATEEQKSKFLNEFWDNLSPTKHNLFNFEKFLYGGTPLHVCERPELWAYLFHMDVLPRDASDAQIVAYHENDSNDDRENPIEKLTPDEFACRINDEMFNDLEFYVRFIKI